LLLAPFYSQFAQAVSNPLASSVIRIPSLTISLQEIACGWVCLHPSRRSRDSTGTLSFQQTGHAPHFQAPGTGNPRNSMLFSGISNFFSLNGYFDEAIKRTEKRRGCSFCSPNSMQILEMAIRKMRARG